MYLLNVSSFPPVCLPLRPMSSPFVSGAMTEPEAIEQKMWVALGDRRSLVCGGHSRLMALAWLWETAKSINTNVGWVEMDVTLSRKYSLDPGHCKILLVS